MSLVIGKTYLGIMDGVADNGDPIVWVRNPCANEGQIPMIEMGRHSDGDAITWMCDECTDTSLTAGKIYLGIMDGVADNGDSIVWVPCCGDPTPQPPPISNGCCSNCPRQIALSFSTGESHVLTYQNHSYYGPSWIFQEKRTVEAEGGAFNFWFRYAVYCFNSGWYYELSLANADHCGATNNCFASFNFFGLGIGQCSPFHWETVAGSFHVEINPAP